jgi:hypothetical protein
MILVYQSKMSSMLTRLTSFFGKQREMRIDHKLCLNDPSGTYTGKEPSPKGLGLCGRGERIGAEYIGRDGKMWVVSKGHKWVHTEQQRAIDKLLKRVKSELMKLMKKTPYLYEVEIKGPTEQSLDEILWDPKKRNYIKANGTLSKAGYKRISLQKPFYAINLFVDPETPEDADYDLLDRLMHRFDGYKVLIYDGADYGPPMMKSGKKVLYKTYFWYYK